MAFKTGKYQESHRAKVGESYSLNPIRRNSGLELQAQWQMGRAHAGYPTSERPGTNLRGLA